jgi:thioredoxin-related protein
MYDYAEDNSVKLQLLSTLAAILLVAFLFSQLCHVCVFAQSKKEVPSINWVEASGKDFTSSEELAKRTIYQDWKGPTGMKSKPLIFYFFWPAEDKKSPDKDAKEQAEKTEKMDKVLDSERVKKEAEQFFCVKVDLRVLKQWGSKGETLAAKYDTKKAPTLVFFDRTGFPQGDISGSTTEATLAEKLSFIASIGSSGSGGDWVTADALDYEDKKSLKKRSVFEDWAQARELGKAKPMIFFFYWPVDDAKDKEADKEAKEQAKKTRELEKILRDSAVSKQLSRFYCFKIDLKELKSFVSEEEGKDYGKAYVAKYKVKKAPYLVIFDYQGTKLMGTTGKMEASKLAKKLKYAADKSDKKLKK